jgi:aryl-alcohol dehydrogenase-like predicted oxidoreductase
MMEKRLLGRTGHMDSIVILGGAAFSESTQETTNATLDLAASRGVNHIDVAASYGHAEERVGPWLESRRDQFFLSTKTGDRSREGAWSELQRSLQRLRTKQIDLYQLHAVVSFEELDKATAPGGAIETFKEAREKGLVRFLGITAHGLQAPAVHAAALERFDFDTVMFPIHPRLFADPNFRRDAERLLNMCIERKVGAMIIKSVTKGPWGEQTKNYTTWYQPYDQQAMIERGIRFALSQPGVVGIPSAGDTRLLPMILDAADRFQPMTAEEQAQAIEDSKDLEPLFQ